MRSDQERLSDILEAAEKVRERVARGRGRFETDEDLQLVLIHLIEPRRSPARPSTRAGTPGCGRRWQRRWQRH